MATGSMGGSRGRLSRCGVKLGHCLGRWHFGKDSEATGLLRDICLKLASRASTRWEEFFLHDAPPEICGAA